ncbi:hypothetical protein E2C01_074838 [Portunus trituberculatus]|uniref:Uncharacterized protein n=1 Tax=Portunus trituberculatus TaxID=210409 RepID=A0A5B7II96_PORTR|nr:hypothetical protein [Portunus trituberculatus]
MKTVVIRCLSEECPRVSNVSSDVVSSIVYETWDVAWSLGAGRGEALLTHAHGRGLEMRSRRDCLYDGRMMFGQTPPVTLKTPRVKEAVGVAEARRTFTPSFQ